MAVAAAALLPPPRPPCDDKDDEDDDEEEDEDDDEEEDEDEDDEDGSGFVSGLRAPRFGGGQGGSGSGPYFCASFAKRRSGLSSYFLAVRWTK